MKIKTLLLLTLLVSTCRSEELKDEIKFIQKELPPDYKIDFKSFQKVICFSGVTIFGGSRIEYEVFPKNSFFRVKRETLQPNNQWVVLKDVSLLKMKTDNPILPESVKEKIRLVGSGLLKVDLSGTALTCWKNNDYFQFQVEKADETKAEGKQDIFLIANINNDKESWLWKSRDIWHEFERLR
jgi:hypothetical protein